MNRNGHVNRTYQTRLDGVESDDDDIEILYTDQERDDVTFQGTKTESVHRWYLLTAAYSPALVRRVLSRFEDERGIDCILDPYSGTGTTLLESKKQGFDAIGVEFNPVYEQVSASKTTWDLDLTELRSLETRLFDSISQKRSEWHDIDIDEFDDKLGVSPPGIYNQNRWWHNYVLKDLLAAREAVRELNTGEEYKQFFRLSVLSILIEVSNAAYNHVSLSYMEDPPEDVDTVTVLAERIQEMLEDVARVQSIDNPGDVEITRGDSTQLAQYVENNAVDTVITSPPYPNRYSYMRETRPHMFFLDLVEGTDEVGNMALKSIGGTWGRATSQLDNVEIEPVNEIVDSLVSDIAAEIGEKDKRMGNYVMKYFNKLEQHLQGIERVVTDDGKLAYTVGNSKLKGVVVPTDTILSEMFRSHGFTDVVIIRERSRNSKTELYEAVVYGYR